MKLFFILISSIFILVGCENNNGNNVLDISKLEREEITLNGDEDVTEEKLKELNLPIPYKAPSVEEGLEALPFDLKLPKDLPFESDGLRPPRIDDIDRDGKKLKVEFLAFPTQKDETIIFWITAYNFELPSTDGKEIQISENVKGELNGNTLSFVNNSIYYDIVYNNTNINQEQFEKAVIDVAKQMLPDE